ncbi:hypothetical protein GCM10008957_54930 [Deinococcus ruber]|uniref:Uncharacterized protein n=1 Tax=Deinococcus ruber TaxID=1848197 RepID=A0A918FI24_9DEIO|nr:hypothetical protein GCM10008957_54930 [Deinococcus ruber]
MNGRKRVMYALLGSLVIFLFFSFYKHIDVSDLYGNWVYSDTDICKNNRCISIELNKDGGFIKNIFINNDLESSQRGKYYFDRDGDSVLNLDFGDYTDGFTVGSDMTFDYPLDVLCTKVSK